MAIPEVSLVMAAYDPEPSWLQLAVRTALGQTGVDHEVIVVDDGSKQPLGELLEPTSDRRLRVVRIDHGGEPVARNAGIDASTGRYLRFIDADDAFPPSSTRQLLDLVNGSDRTMACGATRCCRSDLTPIWDMRAGLSKDPLIPYLLMQSTPMLFSSLIPRTVADAVGPWDRRLVIGADWDYILRVLEHANAVESRAPMVRYRIHDRGASRSRVDSWEGALLGLERFRERHPELRNDDFERQAEAMLDYLAAQLESPTSPWRRRRFWRALRVDAGVAKTLNVQQLRPRVERVRMVLGTRIGAIPG